MKYSKSQIYDDILMNSNEISYYSINSKNLNVNNMPYSKSVSDINLYRNQQIANNLNNTTKITTNNCNELPPIPRTLILQNYKYKPAYDICNQAKGLIQTRLNKLIYEKKILGEMKLNFNPYRADYESIYKLRTLGNAKGKLGNPHLYNNQFMAPIYYPLEMPLTAEPITLPKIEIGHPLGNKKCYGGLGVESILALLAALNKRRPAQQVVYQPTPQQVINPEPIFTEYKRKKKIKGKNKFDDLNKQVIISGNIKKKEGKKIPLKRDWWRLCRDFCNVYTFFSTGRKYSGFAKVRDNIIANKTKEMIQDITVLKEWVISITQSFWEEFKVFIDLNMSFKNLESKIKITK